MAKIHFYVGDPKKFERRMVSITLTDDGNYLVEPQDGGIAIGRFAPSNEEMDRADLLARMQTGKPLSQVEDYF